METASAIAASVAAREAAVDLVAAPEVSAEQAHAPAVVEALPAWAAVAVALAAAAAAVAAAADLVVVVVVVAAVAAGGNELCIGVKQ